MIDNIPAEIGIPIAIALWALVAIQWRREVIRRRKAKRRETYTEPK